MGKRCCEYKISFYKLKHCTYLEGGFHTGLHIDFDDGIDAGAGNLFAGAGLMMGKPNFYFYLGTFTHGENFWAKLGLGWDI